MSKKLSYHKSVNYAQADPMKILAQKEGLATIKNMPFGFKEVKNIRGESAYVFNMGNIYGAFVQEGLGTKSLIAQSIYEKTGKLFFASVAQDTVACIINDLVSVGATPIVLNAYWSSSSYQWLADQKVAKDFIKGWRKACDKSGVVWGGGETQSLPGIVVPGALEFAGSAFGIIKSKRQLVQEKNLRAGDAIVLIEASGVHANGISLIREIASQLKKGYQTKLADGTLFGETVLTPTHLYAKFVHSLLDGELDIHYLSNITGHGWRKLMRATSKFTYLINEVPPVPEVFNFIAKQAGNNEKEMYGNYNMGTGYAVYLPVGKAEGAVQIAKQCGLRAWVAGEVKNGPKQVVIEPKNITFSGDSLGVRS
jgi:phosphoribosylformylglycinamidine cyclo-ligase